VNREDHAYFDKMWVAWIAAAKVADIAAVPAERRQSFCGEAHQLIADPSLGAPLTFTPERRKRLERLERANLELLHALRALPDDEQGYFQDTFSAYQREIINYPRGEVNLDEAVAMAAIVCALLTGKNPDRVKKRRPGRQKGSVRDWAFHDFVRRLWDCANRHGGNLTANCKNNEGIGRMFKALETLRPHFPNGFIPLVLPAQTIANIVKSSRDAKNKRT
jgi:hypothetical protein